MDRKNYTKMLDNNQQEVLIHNDKVNKFLGEGWQVLSSQEKSPVSTKLKLTVNAQVTKPKSESKVDTSQDFIDEVMFDMEDIESDLPEDTNHEDDEDHPNDKKED